MSRDGGAIDCAGDFLLRARGRWKTIEANLGRPLICSRPHLIRLTKLNDGVEAPKRARTVQLVIFIDDSEAGDSIVCDRSSKSWRWVSILRVGDQPRSDEPNLH